MRLISKLFLTGISLFIFQNKTVAFFPNEPELEAFSAKIDSFEIQKKVFRNEMQKELDNILNYWIKNAVDTKNGGFIGSE